MTYLGDIPEDATLDFKWTSADGSGGSITRATDGTIVVYKANGTTESAAGVTDTEDFDSLTGVHHVRIDTSADAFYAAGQDYQVVLQAATIDGETVNSVLREFSIENRTTFPKADYPANFAALGIESDGDLTKVNALDGHTAQTGDSYARLGAPAGASIAADIAEVEDDTQDIQSRLPDALTGAGNLKADALAVEGKTLSGSTGDNFDVFFHSAGLGDPGYTLDAMFAHLFNIEGDTGELQTNQGDWATATGFSTHSAADVWAAVTRTLTANTNLNDPTAAAIAAALLGADASSDTTNSTLGAIINDLEDGGRVDALIDAIKAITDALGATAAARLKLSAETMVTGTVNDDNTAPSTTVFAASDITEATDDHFKGRVVIFTSGALTSQASDITDYALDTGEGKFTVTALTEDPADGDTFIII